MSRVDRWLETATRGKVLVYHIGYLPSDRTDPAIDREAEDALKLFELGLVHLVQRRMDPFLYEYRMVRSSRRY